MFKIDSYILSIHAVRIAFSEAFSKLKFILLEIVLMQISGFEKTRPNCPDMNCMKMLSEMSSRRKMSETNYPDMNLPKFS
jgi:hypothetical protein